MKVFSVCAGLTLLIATLLALWWPATQSLPPEEIVNSKPQVGAYSTAEKPYSEVLAEEDGEEKGRIKKAELGGEEFDTVRIYDSLLLLNFDESGALQLDRNTRATLRAIYSELGADAGPETFSQLRALLEEALPQAEVRRLLDIARNYFAYRQAARDHAIATGMSTGPTPSHANMENLEINGRNYQQLIQLRRNYLGEGVANKLFIEEETQAPYMASAMAVARDKSLSEEERAQRLEELQREFNRAASRMDSPLARKVLDAKVTRMRAAGASEAEIFELRSEVLGSVEAQKLAEEDRNNVARANTP